jgi:predicted Zn-dependent protease
MNRIYFLAIFLFTLGIFTGCSPTMRFKPGQLPVAEPPPKELKIEAEQYVHAHIDEENYQEISSGADLERIKRIIGKVSVAAGYSANQFPVHLVEAGEDVNAAAFNGASIVVYRELLRRVPSDGQLAAVLGHEVGHILAKHYKDAEEEEERAAAVGAGASILGAIASVATSVAGFGGVSNVAGDLTEGASGALGYGAFVGAFSRTQEYEADHIGLILMSRAGYNPEDAVTLWKRSEEVFGSADSTVGSFFSTHPASGDRIEKLQEALPLARDEAKGKKKY